MRDGDPVIRTRPAKAIPAWLESRAATARWLSVSRGGWSPAEAGLS